MPGPTGRALIEQALKEPTRSLGWQPRAAGWFTRELTGDWTGVIAVGTRVEGLPTGHAKATVHIAARHEGVEALVADVCGLKPSYRQRTVVTSIGHLMPEVRWYEWPVDPESVSSTAADLAAAVRDYGDPYLDVVPADPDLVLAQTCRGWLTGSSVDMMRNLAAAVEFATPDHVRRLLDQARLSLADSDHGLSAASKEAALEEFVSRWNRSKSTPFGGPNNYKQGGQMTTIEDMIYRPASTSGFMGVSKFAEGTTVRQMAGYVDDALSPGPVTSNGTNADKVV